MDHVRIDPKFRRRPRPKRAGWAAREVFKFLLEVSAEFDLRGRFPPSMQDVEWLTEEWTNGDGRAWPVASLMLVDNLPKLIAEGLTHMDGEDLVITDWEDFYKPSQTNAERQANWRKRNGRNESNAAVTDDVTSNARNKSNATERHDTEQHDTTPNDSVRTPPASSPAPVVVATPEKRGVALVERPDKPPEEWEGMDFWRWAQDRRQATGYVPERPPHPRKVSVWWSEARSVVAEVKRLKQAFYRYGDDKFWETKDPPYPFAGFMTQWERFVPTEDTHASG